MAFVAVGARSDHARHANTTGINGIIGSTVTVNGMPSYGHQPEMPGRDDTHVQ